MSSFYVDGELYVNNGIFRIRFRILWMKSAARSCILSRMILHFILRLPMEQGACVQDSCGEIPKQCLFGKGCCGKPD